MIVKEYEYEGYIIELHEHPIYKDYEFVIKSKDGKVITASTHPYDYLQDADSTAKLTILKIND